MIGCYVHIPFCVKKCHYCNFTITSSRSKSLRRQFFEAIVQEMKHAHALYGRLVLDTLYLGGGTPSSLLLPEMRYLLQKLHHYFDFKPQAEITCEVNPGEVTLSDLNVYRDLGINRISLGVQTFDSTQLKEMGRAHGVTEILQTFRALAKADFDNISSDLILRLPNQSPTQVIQDIEQAVHLGSKQIVLYDLNVHAGTVFGKRLAKGKLALPTGDEHHEVYLKAQEKLRQLGLFPYEISSFAYPSFEAKHNLIYWQNQPYLGLGPSAFSYMNGVRYQYAQTVKRYLSKVKKANWQNDEEDVLSADEQELETLLVGLRLAKGIRLRDFELLKGRLQKECHLLQKKGLLVSEEGRIKLTARGRSLAETVFTQLSVPTCVTQSE